MNIRLLFSVLSFLCVMSAYAQEFNPLPRSWKWIQPSEVIFSYDGTYYDNTAFAVDARTGKKRNDVSAPEKYADFPINPEGAVNMTYSPDSVNS